MFFWRVGFEIGRTLVNHGYKVCGVRYDSDLNRAEHFIVNNSRRTHSFHWK